MKLPYQINIIIQLFLIIAVTIGASWVCFSLNNFILSGIALPVLLWQITYLIKYQNKTNERINYFFEAIINEDFSTLHHQKREDKSLKKLNDNLTRLNSKLGQIKIDSIKQEQYLRALIEHIGSGVLTFNTKGFVLHANSSLKKLLGLEQLTHIKQLNKVDPKLIGILTNLEVQEQRLITIDLQKRQANLLIKATNFKSQDENLTLLSIQDIDQELDEKELDSWLKLIRVLTHEIMNSIAPVTSLSDTLSNYFKKDGVAIKTEDITDQIIETTIRGLEIIQEQGNGLISFVDSYRKLTRLPKPEKTLVDVNLLLEKTILLSKAGYLKSKQTIQLKNTLNEITILADEKLITQILINLIKNASEAIEELPECGIELSAQKTKGNKIEICVKDNGPGIPPEMLNEIFVPFFTTKEKGSGIGLSLSRQIMRLHNGTLKAHSIPDVETVFKLVFAT